MPYVVANADGKLLRWGVCGNPEMESQQASEPGEQCVVVTLQQLEAIRAEESERDEAGEPIPIPFAVELAELKAKAAIDRAAERRPEDET